MLPYGQLTFITSAQEPAPNIGMTNHKSESSMNETKQVTTFLCWQWLIIEISFLISSMLLSWNYSKLTTLIATSLFRLGEFVSMHLAFQTIPKEPIPIADYS